MALWMRRYAKRKSEREREWERLSETLNEWVKSGWYQRQSESEKVMNDINLFTEL